MQFEVIANERTLQGTSASRRLRRAGKVPGVVYGAETPALAIETNHNDLLLKLKKEAFHASIINLVVNGKKQQVLLRDYQMHPYKPFVLHIDFQRVDPKRELRMKVPIHIINIETAPGIKLTGGLVNHVLNELEIQCLAKDLPEFIEVDIGDMNVGENIHVSQIKLPESVKLVPHGSTEDPIVVGIVAGKLGATTEESAEGEAAPAQ